MPFFNVDVPGFNLPQPQQLPSDVRNPMGTLANTLQSIAAAQQQKRQEEMQIRQQEMQMAEVRRRQEIAAKDYQREEGFRTDLQGLSGRNLTNDQLEEEIAKTALKYGDYDTYQKVQTNLQFKRERNDLDRQKSMTGLAKTFSDNLPGLQKIAQLNPALLKSMGYSPEAISALPPDVDPARKIEMVNDPVLGSRPVVYTKQGRPYFLDEGGVGMQKAREQITSREKIATGNQESREYIAEGGWGQKELDRQSKEQMQTQRLQAMQDRAAKRTSSMEQEAKAGLDWYRSTPMKDFQKFKQDSRGFYSAYETNRKNVAMNKQSAVAQIAAMFKFMSGLDKSVVRPSELALLNSANSITENAKMAIGRAIFPQDIAATTQRTMDAMKDIMDQITASQEENLEKEREYFSLLTHSNIPAYPGTASPSQAPASGGGATGTVDLRDPNAWK